MQGNAQDAGPDLLMRCLAKNTLCGRDEATIGVAYSLSNHLATYPKGPRDILRVRARKKA